MSNYFFSFLFSDFTNFNIVIFYVLFSVTRSENLEASIEALDLSNIKDTICEVKLTNITTMQSIDINTADIKKVFEFALYVNVKREFKTSNDTKTIDDIESLSLEDYFIEHIKEDSKSEEFDRLKIKVQELFSTYEEVYSDIE